MVGLWSCKVSVELNGEGKINVDGFTWGNQKL